MRGNESSLKDNGNELTSMNEHEGESQSQTVVFFSLCDPVHLLLP